MFTQFIPPKTIPYRDARCLTWVSNGIRVEILSSLPKEELIKVAEGFSIGREFPTLNVNASTTTTSLDPASSAAAEAVAEHVAASLVTVKPSGSPVDIGVVYSADGLILTEYTGDGASQKVTLSDGETVTAKLVGYDKTTGVELLRVDKSGLSPVKLASSKPKVGEWMALVWKMGPSLTSTPGSVVASPSIPVDTQMSRLSGMIRVKPAKWSDAPVEAFDKQGDCVGLVIAVVDGTDGKFWGLLPADKVAAAVARLLSGS
jgi:hypothetical protein